MGNLRSVIVIASMILASLCFMSQASNAEQPEAIKTAIIKSDDGVKAEIIAAKAKIDTERNAILAADKRLREVRKTGDKAKIDATRKEVDQEIKTRKDTIKNIKAEIRKKESGAGSFEKGGGRRRSAK